MNSRIIIGNLISFVGAAMLLVSCVMREREKIYFFQLAECLILVVSQLAFGYPSGAVVLLLSALRNFLLWRRRFTFQSSVLIFLAILIFGILTAEGGIISLMPMLATLIYTVTSYRAVRFAAVKMSLFVNLFLWTVYSVLIFDFVTAAVNTLALILNFLSFLRGLRSGTLRGSAMTE